MKKRNIITVLGISLTLFASCGKSFLERDPQAELPESQIVNSKGIEASLIGAYGILNGNVNGTWGNYSSAPSQWLFGEVAGDNAHKGSEATDQPNMNMIEFHTPNSSNDNLSQSLLPALHRAEPLVLVPERVQLLFQVQLLP